jgi:DNA-binding IclR family transcriptional regulator
MSDNARRISTTVRSFRILEALRELDGARIQTLVGEIGVTKSTIYQHLRTLKDAGYVTKEGDYFYPSIRFAHLGEYARNRKEEFIHGRKVARLLTDDIGLNSSFFVEENGFALSVHAEADSTKIPHLYPQVGRRLHLHTVSGGKAILAYLPCRRVSEIIDQHGLPHQTEHTITDENELYAELERIRDRGHAFNRGENRDGVLSVGIPLFDADRSVVGGLSVGGGEYQLDEEWLTDYVPERMKAIRDDNPL